MTKSLQTKAKDLPWFRYFLWVRQPADANCVISVEYYSELLNHASEISEVLARRKLTDYNENRKNKLSVYFSLAGTFQFFDMWFTNFGKRHCTVRVGCKPNRPKSVFYLELPGTRRYTANSFFIMYSEFIGTNLQKTRSARTRPELHVKFRGPISDNGTSNALKWPLTTELDNSGPIFGMRRQNSIRITKKIFLVENGLHLIQNSRRSGGRNG